MSKANVMKIKRLIGKLHSIEEAWEITKAIYGRARILKGRELNRLNEKTFDSVKHLKPGDVLVQCRDQRFFAGEEPETSDVGSTFTVEKVLPRLKALLVRTHRGGILRLDMDSVRNMEFTDNPPPKIAALALRKKINAANGIIEKQEEPVMLFKPIFR